MIHAPTVRMRTSNPLSLRTVAARRPRPLARRSALLLRSAPSLLLLSLSLYGTLHNARADKPKKNTHVQPVAVRIAEGQVVDGSKKPLEGAVVYLENPTSLDIKSYLSDAKGHFHFAQLAPQTDYEVWAEQNGTQSKHKFISQFNNHTRFDFTLTVDPNKKKKLLGFL